MPKPASGESGTDRPPIPHKVGNRKSQARLKIAVQKIFTHTPKRGEEDDTSEVVTAYLASIEINGQYRNQGKGTEVLTRLVEKYGEIWLCAENDRCKHLYERLGEECSYSRCPDSLKGSFDEYGHIYLLR